MPKKSEPASTDVEYIRHDHETRPNIPTQELKDFVADDEVRETRAIYERDPSLDPQLVWKGKEEQDKEDLAVPTVPIYIQEKIHPSVIIEDLRQRQAKGGTSQNELNLFSDFNGIEDFDKKVDFYHHEGHWTNRLILGDSLLVMNSLAEKEGLKGRVQCIYFDPPYGIKFGSNWQVSTRKRQVGDKVEDATRQPEQVRAFRDTWKLGIHSYLGYLRDRLTVARDLLTESGSVFVQIGDENVHLVRNVLDEVFGAENWVSNIHFKKTGASGSELLDNVADTILWYAKGVANLKYRALFQNREEGTSLFEAYNQIDELGLRFSSAPLTSNRPAQGGDLKEFHYNGRRFTPGNGTFKTDESGLTRLAEAGRLIEAKGVLRYKRFLDDFPVAPYTNLWTDSMGASATEKVYVVQTASKIAQRCILMASDPGDLVLDPTCGSGTTAFVAEQWGRRWITIDTSRVALTLARTRLLSARFPFYLMADSVEGQAREAEVTGKVAPSHKTENDIRKGFVYKRVPHIKLGSIANNPEVSPIYKRFEPLLDHCLNLLNHHSNNSWNRDNVPRSEEAEQDIRFSRIEWAPGHPDASDVESANDIDFSLDQVDQPNRAFVAYSYYWKLFDERRTLLNEAISRYADTELLFDQPYEDSNRIRVTGPFTVESLAPHRVLETDEDAETSIGSQKTEADRPDFATMILENLRKTGVSNTRKSEKLKFDALEPFSGVYLHAKGSYTDSEGESKSVAISIGPEFGTVGPDWIKEAAKEAVRGIGFDLLIVCGFSFDGYASEEAKQFGKLTVLTARMNNDLSMGDDLLKKTGAGNLFMVFGEPDVTIHKEDNGQVSAEIKGLDVYDPTTGQIRSGSTDDLAVWFIDTNYNEESFFVRHAYFLGADDPYAKLKRALRAEIDEGAWSALYSTRSQPFDKPQTGKIAIKVINHYGDEVLKVYDVK